VEALAAILAALSVSLKEFFRSFKKVVRPRTPRLGGNSQSVLKVDSLADHLGETGSKLCLRVFDKS